MLDQLLTLYAVCFCSVAVLAVCVVASLVDVAGFCQSQWCISVLDPFSGDAFGVFVVFPLLLFSYCLLLLVQCLSAPKTHNRNS